MLNLRKILVPTDFSDVSKKALRYAKALAAVHGAEILVLHVVEDTAYPIETVLRQGNFPHLRDEITKVLKRQLEDLLKTEFEGGGKLRALSASGKPFVEICRVAAAEDVDLIVIATHGHTGIKHVILGSNAERVVRQAPCPVLTVRDKASKVIAGSS
jgi:nucleotide-binding universal stress UspA family protein